MASAAVQPPAALVEARTKPGKPWPLYLLFFVSGCPALLYQIVWQRALFTIYGVNIQSVTVIVTVFMLGLGLGSLAGGKLSAIGRLPLLRAFGAIEVCIGIFGAVSLTLFHHVAVFTAGASTAATGAITFLLLVVPTLLMGSTLPLLVRYLVQKTANVGESVGSLYAVNTLGSGAACLLASIFVMRTLGESGAVRLAALLNILVGTTALVWQARTATADAAPLPDPPTVSDQPTIPFAVGMLLAGLTGFVALAYEIIWYRIYAFSTGSSAPCFANLLAFYLFGIAYGSFVVHDICRKKLRADLSRTLRAGSSVVLLGAIAAYLLGPTVSVLVAHVTYTLTLLLVAIAAALLGAAFPLLSHAAIGPTGQAGKKLSYLYLSNIVGSALGSFLIGFIVLDHWSTGAASVMLLGLGFAVALVLAILAGPSRSRAFLASGFAVCAVLAFSSHALFSGLYSRLLFKGNPHNGITLVELVENRSGAIAVDSLETVYGGGAYDGHFNIDPVHDDNGIFRAYAVAALHPHPRRILIIGLSSGSWAQVVANLPGVQDVTIVEINPGYLPLIRERRSVASLLSNPKVHIVIDDGRRWLVSHPNSQFDFILMNTTYHWRSNVSNLLSTDFLHLIRQHLLPGGVEYYNTTDSVEAQFTGISVFPYAMRVANFLAVSDSPIDFDRAHWRQILEAWTIDGRPVFDLSDPAQRARLDAMVSIPEVQREVFGHGLDITIEPRSTMLARFQGVRPITDDNMGVEWQPDEIQ